MAAAPIPFLLIPSVCQTVSVHLCFRDSPLLTQAIWRPSCSLDVHFHLSILNHLPLTKSSMEYYRHEGMAAPSRPKDGSSAIAAAAAILSGPRRGGSITSSSIGSKSGKSKGKSASRKSKASAALTAAAVAALRPEARVSSGPNVRGIPYWDARLPRGSSSISGKQHPSSSPEHIRNTCTTADVAVNCSQCYKRCMYVGGSMACAEDATARAGADLLLSFLYSASRPGSPATVKSA